MVRMYSPKGGWMHCYSQTEVDHCLSVGWEIVPEPVVERVVEAPVVAPPPTMQMVKGLDVPKFGEVKRGPGRPPKPKPDVVMIGSHAATPLAEDEMAKWRAIDQDDGA